VLALAFVFKQSGNQPQGRAAEAAPVEA